MSIYTSNYLVAAVAYERLKAMNPEAQPSLIPRLQAMVTPAMARIARDVARTDFEGLQATIVNLTLTNGQFDLSTVAGILFDPLKSVLWFSASFPAWPAAVFIPSVEDLEAIEETGDDVPVFYSQRGQYLLFRDPVTGLLGQLSTSFDLTTNYIPALTATATLPALPNQYDGLLIETLVEMAVGRGMAAVEMAGVGRT